MHVLLIGILPPDTPVSDVPEAFARLVQQYEVDGVIKPYKVYLDEYELFLRWRESVPSDLLAEVGFSPKEDYPLDTGPEKDRNGYYVWSTEPRQQEWLSWHIGGRWHGVLCGEPVKAHADCECEDQEEHIRQNLCRVSDLPSGLWPKVYVTPDSEWHRVWGVREGQTTDYEGHTFTQLVTEYQDYLAVIVDCQVPPTKDTDDPELDSIGGAGFGKMDACVDPEEAADAFAGTPFRVAPPPPVTSRSHLYMWARAGNRRVREWRGKRPPANADELLELWLLRLQIKLALTTLWRTHWAIRQFIRWVEAHQQRLPLPSDLNPSGVLREYAASLQQSQTSHTIKTHLQAIQTWGKGLTTRPAPISLQKPRQKPVKRRTTFFPQLLTDQQIEALLQAAARSDFPARDQAILGLLLATGMRLGELAHLAWQDLRLAETHGEIWLQVRKEDAHRWLPLHAAICQALICYRADLLQVDDPLQALEESWLTHSPDLPREPLWQRQDGSPLSQRALSRIVVALARESRVIVPPEAAAHRIRSTFIYERLLLNPGDLKALPQILGIHVATLQRYADFIERQQHAEHLGLLKPYQGLG